MDISISVMIQNIFDSQQTAKDTPLTKYWGLILPKSNRKIEVIDSICLSVQLPGRPQLPVHICQEQTDWCPTARRLPAGPWSLQPSATWRSAVDGMSLTTQHSSTGHVR